MQAHAWAQIVSEMRCNPKFALINGSLNGPGSSIEFTKGLREELPYLLLEYRVQTMLDAPCGDFTWMQTVDISNVYSYIGMDVDEHLIQRNKTKYRSWKNVSFVRTNLLKQRLFPRRDLILCRDFLAHLPNEYINHMLDKFRASGSKYLLASNYPGASNDFEYKPMDYPWLGYMEHQHDLTTEPFNLHQIDRIPEQSPPGGVLANEHELGLFDLKV